LTQSDDYAIIAKSSIIKFEEDNIMSVEKAVIQGFIDVYKARMGASRRRNGAHPAIVGAEGVLATSAGGPLTDEQQLNIILCYIKNPVERQRVPNMFESAFSRPVKERPGSFDALLSILHALRVAKTAAPAELDPVMLEKLFDILVLLNEANLLDAQRFNAALRCGNPVAVFYAIQYPLYEKNLAQIQTILEQPLPSAPPLAIADQNFPNNNNNIDNNIYPMALLPAAAPQPLALRQEANNRVQFVYDLLPPDMRRLLKQYCTLLPLRERACLAAMNRDFFGFFNRNVKPEVNIGPDRIAYKALMKTALSVVPTETRTVLENSPRLVAPGYISLTKFLIHVVKGEKKQAKDMLKLNPQLLLTKGWIVDCSERFFFGTGIPGFWYALLARDEEMVKMMMSFIRQMGPDEGRAIVAAQLQELNNTLADPKAENHAALMNLFKALYKCSKVSGKLIEHAKKYLASNYDSIGLEALKQEFRREYGKTLRMLPAWYILFMCQKGMNSPYTSKDITTKFNRDSMLLNEWFVTEIVDGRVKLGYTYGLYRGTYSGIQFTQEILNDRGYSSFSYSRVYELNTHIIHDHAVVSLFCETARPRPLPTLEDLYGEQQHQAGCAIQ
jgi:hypothetical protein